MEFRLWGKAISLGERSCGLGRGDGRRVRLLEGSAARVDEALELFRRLGVRGGDVDDDVERVRHVGDDGVGALEVELVRLGGETEAQSELLLGPQHGHHVGVRLERLDDAETDLLQEVRRTDLVAVPRRHHVQLSHPVLEVLVHPRAGELQHVLLHRLHQVLGTAYGELDHATRVGLAETDRVHPVVGRDRDVQDGLPEGDDLGVDLVIGAQEAVERRDERLDAGGGVLSLLFGRHVCDRPLVMSMQFRGRDYP